MKPDAADELHELPAAPVPAPAPEPGPAAVPLPTVPPALLDHARKVADTYRSTTGSAIDAETLRTRLGVPAPLATAITAQLA